MFEKGDLEKKTSAYLTSWVYLEDKGFFPFGNARFEKLETVISADKIGDFINEHRLWLNEHEGFQIHLSNVEFKLSYQFDLKSFGLKVNQARLMEAEIF